MKILKKNCIYCGKQFEKSYCRSVADFLKRAKYYSKWINIDKANQLVHRKQLFKKEMTCGRLIREKSDMVP